MRIEFTFNVGGTVEVPTVILVNADTDKKDVQEVVEADVVSSIVGGLLNKHNMDFRKIKVLP